MNGQEKEQLKLQFAHSVALWDLSQTKLNRNMEIWAESPPKILISNMETKQWSKEEFKKKRKTRPMKWTSDGLNFFSPIHNKKS